MFILIAISFLVFAAYAILIENYRRAWKAMPLYIPDEKIMAATTTKIAVIIPVRNEEKNIQILLDALFLQSYPKNLYQVIVVDDHSTDGTRDLVNSLEYEKMELRLLNLADYANDSKIIAHKKLAIETAIGVANATLIVTTDADCRPGPDWLQTIAAFHASTHAKLIAAPVKINVGNSFLSIFQTLDFITLQGITGAAVSQKTHSMCNGANLAYEKAVFEEVGGFKGIDQIPSGDDMFLMHKIFKKYPDQVFFLKNRDAVVLTQPETSWAGFINQRVRWASKADKYDDKGIFWALLLAYTFNFLFPILFAAGFWRPQSWLWLIALLLLKTVVEFPFVKSASLFFEQQNLMRYFPFLQPLHILYTIVIGWLGKFGSYKWKGRKIN
ncbi:MAG: glycosyltransferase [Bacteroidetes bacterium]|nr:glycosyltransferase [Bacteroidota bacterium]